jgi:hypothetical protein
MNQRIRELAEKAQAYADQQWLEAGYPSWENYQEVFAEDHNKKFAELIVKECINTLEFHGFDDAVPYIKWMATNNLGVKE